MGAKAVKTIADYGKKVIGKAIEGGSILRKTISANSAIDTAVTKKLTQLQELQNISKMGPKTKKYKSAVKAYADNYGGDAVEEIKKMGEGLAENINKHQSLLNDMAGKTTAEKLALARKSGIYGSDKALAWDAVKNYYAGEGLKTGLVRGGATVGAYAGVNLAGRALTGGDAYHNNKGERDIAGVPFF
jgi:hypothetical protein